MVDLRLIASRYLVCRISLPRREIAGMLILRDANLLQGNPQFGETTAVLTVDQPGPGSYLCIVTTTDGRILRSSLEIESPPSPPSFLSPPNSLTADWVAGDDGNLGNIRVTWEEPSISEGLLGYKINWDQPGL